MAADKDDERKPAEVLRDAVERTFREAADNMAAVGPRAQGLLDDVAAAITRLRESTGEERGDATAQAIEALTARVEALAARVEAPEHGPKAKAKAKTKAPRKKAGS